MATTKVLDAAYFDQWYADMAASRDRDPVFNRALGLPAGLQSTSLLPWEGIAELVEHLRLAAGGVVVDAACGRGGHGLEVARRTAARLIGVDFSAVALEQARGSSAQLLPAGRAEFRVGTLLETGLPAGVADAVMCVDSLQFAEPPLSALREFRRILAPGGRLAVTTWQAVDPADDRVSPRIRGVDLQRDLPAAGFVDVQVHDKADWRASERIAWEQVLAAPADPDPAVHSLQEEGRRSLEKFDTLRRCFATATAP